jgi:signal transduction histidine kinase
VVIAERPWVRLAKLAAVAIVYVAAGKLGLSMAIDLRNTSAVWPPTGISIAALLVLGPRVWPAISVGAFIVNFQLSKNVGSSLAIAGGNTLEAVVAVFLVERFANGARAFDRAPDYFRYIIFAAVVGPILSATVGVTSLCVVGEHGWPEFETIWMTWWLGDASSAMIVAPPLILWMASPLPHWTRAQTIEFIALLVALLVLADRIFTRFLAPNLGTVPIMSMVGPPLIWAALRFGPRVTSTASLLLATIATTGTLLGRGFFAQMPAGHALTLLLTYLLISVSTTLLIAVIGRERERALELLRSKTRELERSNTDLEQFAYVASHDLQEPLRNLLLYLELVEHESGSGLNSKSREHLSVARQSGIRMRGLIQDLLAYARTGVRKQTTAEVDVRDVAKTVIGDLKSAIDESRAKVEVGLLPKLRTDPIQVGEVLQNLIGNAIKFRRGTEPRVQIGSVRENSEWRFYVRDDGIGIAPSEQEKVFEIFHRLNPRDLYSGNGIGLATCKRIIERLGGRIWIESRPGAGSTLWFTLPAETNGAAAAEPSRAQGSHGAHA